MPASIRIVSAALMITVSAASVAVSPPTSHSHPYSYSPIASLTPRGQDPSDRAQFAISSRIDRIGRLIAPVMIDGQGPFRFMVDTGATRTVLAAATAARLKLAASPESQISVEGINASAVVSSVHVDQFDTGDMHFHDLDLPVLDGPVLDGIDGILGMDGFADMKMSADFDKDRIVISQSTGRRASYLYSVIPVQFLSERLLMTDAYVGRIRVKAIIDTGGMHTIANLALLQAIEHGRSNDPQLFETGVVDATQTSALAHMRRVPVVHMGAAVISGLSVTFADFRVFDTWGLNDQPALLIGMDVLGTLSELNIDYRRGEVQLLTHGPVSITHW